MWHFIYKCLLIRKNGRYAHYYPFSAIYHHLGMGLSHIPEFHWRAESTSKGEIFGYYPLSNSKNMLLSYRQYFKA